MNTDYKLSSKIDVDYEQLFADGQYEIAIQLMENFLKDCTQEENPFGSMVAHINIATCYYCLGKIEKAFENVLQYKQLCEEFGKEHDRYYLYYISALIYEYDQAYERALTSIQHCIELASSLQLYTELSTSYNRASYLYLVTEQYDQALSFAQKALEVTTQYNIENQFLKSQITCNLASSHVHLEQFDDASYFIQVLTGNRYIQKNPYERSRFLYTAGLLKLKKVQIDDAIRIFIEAQTIAVSFNDQIILKHILWSLALAYEQKGHYADAYKYLRKYVEVEEEMNRLRSLSKILELDLKHSISAIEHRAHTDSLSGVFNRYYLELTCNQWLQAARNTKDSICCITFDVDNFKSINDQYGHLAGDEVIKMLGKTCLTITEHDEAIVGRYGGDEFVILLKNLSPQSIMSKAKEIFNALTTAVVDHEDNRIQITISMGIVCNTSIIARKFTQLFRVADQALYMAKQQGKNQIVTLSNTNCLLER
ncbi:tetratricopeptide repeat-containing diguanylate cyclase [Lysinibacillus sp. 54212]|uniref:tetratricopeptide repeat-containing diguanylate cyclase n=1 Tax=Lysinibacillus sp. 54212 TaxID=3119829 RepID=UPI002FC940B6